MLYVTLGGESVNAVLQSY